MKKLIVLLLLSFLLLSCSGYRETADDIWLGEILTIDSSDSIAEALAVKDGTILAVGKRDEVLSLTGKRTRIHTLEPGTVLMPGFIAAHEHPAISAVFSGLTDLSGLTHTSAASMWAELKDAIDRAKPGEWIYGMGIDPVLMPDLGIIDRDLLDELAPENPVLLISQSIHSYWVNSLAYAEVGIDESTEDPAEGGHYGRDETGRLNGFIAEPAAAAPFVKPLKNPLGVIGKYKNQLEELSRYGYTTVASLGFNAPPLMTRFIGLNHFRPFIRQRFYMTEDELGYLPSSPAKGNDYFKILGVKLWHDGSPYTGSMLLEEPYLHNNLTSRMGIEEGQTGESLIAEADLTEKIKTYHSQGWQISIHSQGDASNNMVVRALKKTGLDLGDSRVRLEHGVLLPVERLKELKEYGVSPSFHINHLYYYGDALEESIIGTDRASRLLPVHSSFELDLHPTLHADSPMFPPDPFSLMRTAVTRKSRSGRSLNPGESLSPSQAIRAMTINAAWQLKMDDLVGSLEPGKKADLIILSRNPLTTDADMWIEIKVRERWTEGRRLTDF